MKASRDTMPDVFWYQLNGDSAIDNYNKQKKAIYERLTASETDNGFNINFTSEVKVVWAKREKIRKRNKTKVGLKQKY